MRKELEIIPHERIEGRIFLVRGKKVMFDRDLALLYGVQTKALNQAVQRNRLRFPEDFMFRLTKEEMAIWKSQIVTSTKDRKGLRKQPAVFTEQGVAMLSSVLRSKQAIQVNIQIIRTFTKLREMIAGDQGLKRKLDALERKYDEQFKEIFSVIRALLADRRERADREIEEKSRGEIGFKLQKR